MHCARLGEKTFLIGPHSIGNFPITMTSAHDELATSGSNGDGSIGSGADRHSVQFSENATRSMLERLARRCVASSTGVTVRRE